MEKFLDYLEDRRAGRAFLQFLGINRNNDEPAYFRAVVGSNSRKPVGDYRLYFRSENTAARVVNNFAFREMAKLGPVECINFLQYHYDQTENPVGYLKYLKTAIPFRVKGYRSDVQEIFAYCLDWVNESLSNSIEKNETGKNQVAVINKIQIENHSSNVVGSDANISFHKEINELRNELKNLSSRNEFKNSQQPDYDYEKLNDIVQRLERVDKGIDLFEFGQIENTNPDGLKHFVFLFLALKDFHLNNNPKAAFFFSKLTKVDITKLLKLNFKYYNDKALKTVEKDVNKFDEEFKTLDLDTLHKDLKRLLKNFTNIK